MKKIAPVADSNAKDDQELLHSNAEDGTCISQCLTSMHATTCVSINTSTVS